MRRSTLALALVTSLLFAPAAAAQQRDPFDPVIEADTGASVPDGVSVEVPVVLPVPDPNDPLPSTGTDLSAYLGAAYLLIALGGMGIMLARINSTSLRADSRSR